MTVDWWILFTGLMTGVAIVLAGLLWLRYQYDHCPAERLNRAASSELWFITGYRGDRPDHLLFMPAGSMQPMGRLYVVKAHPTGETTWKLQIEPRDTTEQTTTAWGIIEPGRIASLLSSLGPHVEAGDTSVCIDLTKVSDQQLRDFFSRAYNVLIASLQPLVFCAKCGERGSRRYNTAGTYGQCFCTCPTRNGEPEIRQSSDHLYHCQTCRKNLGTNQDTVAAHAESHCRAHTVKECGVRVGPIVTACIAGEWVSGKTIDYLTPIGELFAQPEDVTAGPVIDKFTALGGNIVRDGEPILVDSKTAERLQSALLVVRQDLMIIHEHIKVRTSEATDPVVRRALEKQLTGVQDQLERLSTATGLPQAGPIEDLDTMLQTEALRGESVLA